MPAKAVVLLPEAAGARVEQMNALASGVTFERVDPTADLAAIHAACAGAEVLVAPNRPATNDIAAGIEGLKLVQTFSAGTEGLDKARLVNLGIEIANCGGGNAACVAEHAIGLLLMVNAVESTVNVTRNAVENAERIARGERPEWVVDPV